MRISLIILVIMLVLISAADIRTMKIPEIMIIIAAAASFIGLFEGVTLKEYLTGLIPAAVILAAVLIMEALVHRKLMGGGDIRLIAVIGLYLGMESTFIAVLIAAAAAIPVRMIKRDGTKAFPFAPMLAAGALIVIIAGQLLFVRIQGL